MSVPGSAPAIADVATTRRPLPRGRAPALELEPGRRAAAVCAQSKRATIRSPLGKERGIDDVGWPPSRSISAATARGVLVGSRAMIRTLMAGPSSRESPEFRGQPLVLLIQLVHGFGVPGLELPRGIGLGRLFAGLLVLGDLLLQGFDCGLVGLRERLRPRHRVVPR